MSLKATPVRATPASGLVIVKVSVAVSPATIGLGWNSLWSSGGSKTVNVSLAVFPVPPLVELTAPLTLLYVPAVGAVTSTLTVHVPLAAIVPPENDIDPSPAFAVTVPPHVVLAAGVPATTIFPGKVGKVSLKATSVKAVPALGLVIVKVRVLVSHAPIGSGEKFLLIDGGSGRGSTPPSPL